MSLGRVSVLLGSGAHYERACRGRPQYDPGGMPFIDDYVLTPEPVVDYLTRFSGLRQGDLDAAVTGHHLVPLRTAYLKLRCLVDRGCIFVGHGLKKDFRIVNIVVPPEQVVDTVHLFHLGGQRMLSLRFLAATLLKIDVQAAGAGGHDSIEDARTALLLYKKYLALKEAGQFRQTLEQLYAHGRATGWVVTTTTQQQ